MTTATKDNTPRLSGETDGDWAKRIAKKNRTPEQAAKQRAARAAEKAAKK
jgi:hypothetical protein